MVLKIIIICVVSYFFGNISFARILAGFKKKDITASGSGNPGTMNMLRTFGVKAGAITLLLDFLKAIIPCVIAKLLLIPHGLGDIGIFVAGISVIIGHIYPVVYKFKGGKGIACAIGVFAVANPLVLLLFFVVAFLYLWFFDYGAIASFIIITGLTCVQGYNYYNKFLDGGFTHNEYSTLAILLFSIFILTWYAHRKNIMRMLLGKENKANLQYHIKKKMKKQNYKTLKNEYKKEVSEEKQKLKGKISNKKDEYLKQVEELRPEEKPNFTPLIVEERITFERLKSRKKKVYKLDKAFAKADFKSTKKAIKKEYREDKEEIKNNLVEKVFDELVLDN